MLGSTGSIGTQTLEIASEQPDKFKAVALSAGRNINLLTEQVKTHKPEVAAIEDENLIEDLKDNINNLDLDVAPLVLGGKQGINAVAAWDKADTVVTGIVGCAGLIPTMSAINAGKNIALANKETLIAAGPIVIPALKKIIAGYYLLIQNTLLSFNVYKDYLIMKMPIFQQERCLRV